MITTLEEFNTHSLAMKLGEEVWAIVTHWNHFEKDTIGKQWVRAVDSIAANLSEGLGRYHFKESKNFSYYAIGSLFETKTWLLKSFNRKLIDENQFKQLEDDMESIGKMINTYIKSIGNKP